MGDLVSIRCKRPLGLLRGTSATAWYDRGCVAEARSPRAAIAAYRRALAGWPEHADAHNNLARLLHEQVLTEGFGATGKVTLAAAEAHYRLAICARADVALYWFNLGVVVEDQGRPSEAIACYERALALAPQLADAHFNLARLLELVGRQGKDELALRRAMNHLLRYRDLGHLASGT